MKNLFFWAQSLDNQSPDLIFRDYEEVSNDVERQRIISIIYEVPGKKIEFPLPNSTVTIRYSDPKFVVEAIPTEKDQANRLAPIVIYGELPEEFSSNWIETSCDEISKVVANKLNRTLSGDVLVTIENWLTGVLKEKKKKAEVQKQIISLITVFLVPLLIGWVIQVQDIHLTLLQMSGLIGLNNLLIMLFQSFVINGYQRKLRSR